MEFKEELKKFRKENKLTKVELAKNQTLILQQ